MHKERDSFINVNTRPWIGSSIKGDACEFVRTLELLLIANHVVDGQVPSGSNEVLLKANESRLNYATADDGSCLAVFCRVLFYCVLLVCSMSETTRCRRGF